MHTLHTLTNVAFFLFEILIFISLNHLYFCYIFGLLKQHFHSFLHNTPEWLLTTMFKHSYLIRTNPEVVRYSSGHKCGNKSSFLTFFNLQSKPKGGLSMITERTIIYIIIRCVFSFLSIGRKSTTWPANNCLQTMVCSCVVPSKRVLQQIIFCSCVIGTTFAREKWQIASQSCQEVIKIWK